MVDRGCSSRAENKRFTKSAKSRKSSSASSEFDEDFRERLEGRYLGNGLEIRPPSGTHHQQPGSHLSVDTRLSELSLVESDLLIASDTAYSSNRTSASSKKPNPYQVLTEKPNCYITSPFKQGYHVTKKGTSKVVDPSVQLKKVTQDSIDRVRQQFRRPKPPPRTSVYTPRLVKAKLKTTGRPISGSGPSIKQCKGIQAGGHVAGRPKPSYYCYYNDEPPYTRSPSLRPTSPTELHRPESSIHCTSRVQSQLDDDSCSDQTFSSCSSVVIDSLQPRNGNDDDNCDDDDDNGENVKASDHRDLVDTSHQPDATRSPDQSDDLKRSPDQNRDLQRPSDQNDDLKRSPYQNKDELQQSLDKNKDDLKISLDPNEDQKELLFHDLGVQNASDIKDADSAEQVANASLQNCSDSQEKYHDDHSDKVTGDESYEKSLSDEIKSKRGNENCKPFTDGINGNHDNDDEDDDDENRKRTLLGRYSHEHYSLVENSTHDNNLTRSDSGKNVTNGRKMTNKSTMRKESVLGNENKMKNENRKRDDNTITNTTKTDHEMRNKTKMGNENKMKVENQMKFSAPNTSIESNNSSTSTKLFTTPSQNHTVEIKKSNKDDTDSQVHIINSTSINGTSPVMTVHVCGVRENDKKQNSASDVSNDFDFNKVDSDGDFMTYVDDVDDDADDDRIPSAIIWKNLDQLNLSMNASSVPLSRNDFHSKARKVQSAGSRRPKTTEHSNSSFDSIKTKPKSRASSAKRKRTKSKVKTQNKEEVDKAELMRKYLSEESRKFSAELPGYFTEQFNIIQETKSGTRMSRKYESGPDSKALVKYKGQDDHEGVYQNEDDEGNESILYLVEVEDPSSAVFFTMDSTTNSTCDIESISGQTDQMSNDTRELSDDTGFETMAGSGLSGKHDSVGKVDSGIGMHDGAAIDMEDDVKNEQFRFNANLEDLEVVAKAKHLTDPKCSNSCNSTCPLEPLKFTINARPPPGFLYYFAYGVDMNAKRMSLYLRREYKRLWGILFGFKLRFNKKGTSSDAGGFANVEFSPGDSVEGCVYTVTDADLSMLDNCMGYPKHYCRVVLPVWMSNCHDPDQHGVAQYCVPAVLYAAQQQWLEPGKTDFLDCSYSVSQCLKASDILTPNYVDYLNHLVA